MAKWNHDSDSEPEVDIQYMSDTNSDTNSVNQPLANKQPSISFKRKHNSPTRITSDKLSIMFGKKTSMLVKTKTQIARKIIMRRIKEPRETIKPLWNLLPGGTITNYIPHTITIDTPTRKNTVVRKRIIAIAADTRTLVKTMQAKPRLMEFVACKTVGEYNRNRGAKPNKSKNSNNLRPNWTKETSSTTSQTKETARALRKTKSKREQNAKPTQRAL